MGTSRGQCCNICVTTRAYNNNGKQLWQNSFDTDTIDMYVDSGDVHLIGNDFLSFQYLNEISPIGSGLKQKYILPFKTDVYNNNNYRIINNNKFVKKENNPIISSNKTLAYIDSFNFVEFSGYIPTNQSVELTNKHSYPLELYSDNTKIAKIFAKDDNLFVVKDNKIFEYHTTGIHSELKNISFFNKNIHHPMFDGDFIYVGEKTYNYGNIEFNQKTKFSSGLPIDNSTENISISFNYSSNFPPTGHINNYVSDIVIKNKNYTDSMSFRFNTGILDILIHNTGCLNNYKSININDLFWYGGLSSGLNDNILAKKLYDNNTSFCEPIFYSGWLVNNLQFEPEKIKINLIKLHDTISSGDLFYDYSDSIFNGPSIYPSGSGYIATWVGEYDIKKKITLEKQINVDSIINQDYLLNHFTYVSGYTQDYMFGFYGFDSGNVIRKGKVVGDWKISDYDYSIEYKSNNRYLIKLQPNITIKDYSYDSSFVETKGNGYSFMRNSFYLAKHTVTYPTSVDLDYNMKRVEWKTGLFGNEAIYFMDTNFNIGPTTTKSSYDIEAVRGPINNWDFDSSSWSLYNTFVLAKYDIALQLYSIANFYNLHNNHGNPYDLGSLYDATGNYDFPEYVHCGPTIGNATTYLEFYVPADMSSETGVLSSDVGSLVVYSGGLRDYIAPIARLTSFPYTANSNVVVVDKYGAKIGCLYPEDGNITASGQWMFEPVYSGVPDLCYLRIEDNLPCLNVSGIRWYANYYYLSNTLYSIGDGCTGAPNGDFFIRGECGTPYVSGYNYSKLPLLIIDGYAHSIPETNYITNIQNETCVIKEWNCNHLASSILYYPRTYISLFADLSNFIGPSSEYFTTLAGLATNYNKPNIAQGYAPFVISYSTLYQHPFESMANVVWPENVDLPPFPLLEQREYHSPFLGEFNSKRLYSINIGGIYSTGDKTSFGPINFGKLDYEINNGLFDGNLIYSNNFNTGGPQTMPTRIKVSRNGSWHVFSPTVEYQHTSGEFRYDGINGSGSIASFNSNIEDNLYAIIKDNLSYILEHRYKINYV